MKKSIFYEDEMQSNLPTLPTLRGVDAATAIKGTQSWMHWLNYEYQSLKMDDRGGKNNAAILDNCPGCGSSGFVPITINNYACAEACNVCKTGADKKERLGLCLSQEKAQCQFTYECPFVNEQQKQLKCKLVKCKFDRSSL